MRKSVKPLCRRLRDYDKETKKHSCMIEEWEKE